MNESSASFSAANIRPIRSLLQVNVCLLFGLSGLMFAAAEGGPLGLISVPVAFAGLVLTDRREVFGLSVLWANVLGFGAFLAAGGEFFGESIEGRLLGFGHLLLYLGWILMLQRKGRPQFWWLCALSTLQVATASVLTNDVWFPLSAMLFMMLALWTLSVFSLDRAVERSAGVERGSRLARGQSPHQSRARQEATAHTSSTSATETGDQGDASRSRSNVRVESATRWVTPRFVLGVLVNGVLSLLLGLAIFILTPRIWAGSFRLFDDSSPSASQPLTGFAEEVSLGDMGEILENPDIVLEVEFLNDQTGERLDVEQTMGQLGYDAPIFRGKVLGQYSNGRWTMPVLTEPSNRFRPPRRMPLIRQEILLHPIGTWTLFTTGRAIGCRADEVAIFHEQFNGTFTVEPSREARRRLRKVFAYRAYSSLTGETLRPRPGSNDWPLLGEYHTTMLSVPEGLERLEFLARELTRPEDGTILSEAQIAQRLVDHLRNSGEYAYSMKVSIDDPTIDPVEDFLFNRKQGHCEYYASALALMLRSANIPARLISGFKGGALNDETGRFEVRQLHAHAWVEALIDHEWVVLDATPAARDVSVASISTSLSPFAQAQRLLKSWWSHGLLMNQSQQQRAIYEPLREMFGGGLESVRRVGLLQAIAQWFRQLSANPDEWISWRGFFTVFSLGLLLAGIVVTGKKLWGLLMGLVVHKKRRQRQQRRVVAFYERFRSLVGRAGHARDDAATHREFALSIERDWSNRPDIDGLARLPSRLTDAFYRVRFGDQPLGDEELQAIEASLGRLEDWISR